jgi:hypothetical protein
MGYGSGCPKYVYLVSEAIVELAGESGGRLLV